MRHVCSCVCAPCTFENGVELYLLHSPHKRHSDAPHQSVCRSDPRSERRAGLPHCLGSWRNCLPFPRVFGLRVSTACSLEFSISLLGLFQVWGPPSWSPLLV